MITVEYWIGDSVLAIQLYICIFHRARHPYEFSRFSAATIAEAQVFQADADAVYVSEVANAVQCHLLPFLIVQVQLLIKLSLPSVRVSVAAWDLL